MRCGSQTNNRILTVLWMSIMTETNRGWHQVGCFRCVDQCFQLSVSVVGQTLYSTASFMQHLYCTGELVTVSSCCDWLIQVRWTLAIVLCPTSCTAQTRKPQLVTCRLAARSRLGLQWMSGYVTDDVVTVLYCLLLSMVPPCEMSHLSLKHSK